MGNGFFESHQKVNTLIVFYRTLMRLQLMEHREFGVFSEVRAAVFRFNTEPNTTKPMKFD